jgi:hypothetical protein
MPCSNKWPPWFAVAADESCGPYERTRKTLTVGHQPVSRPARDTNPRAPFGLALHTSYPLAGVVGYGAVLHLENLITFPR